MTDFQTAYAQHVHYFLAKIDAPRVCRSCGYADCPGASSGDCPRWPARDEEPERFGPGYVTDLCRCGHERGEHWDGEGTCDPETCGCRTFRPDRTGE